MGRRELARATARFCSVALPRPQSRQAFSAARFSGAAAIHRLWGSFLDDRHNQKRGRSCDVKGRHGPQTVVTALWRSPAAKSAGLFIPGFRLPLRSITAELVSGQHHGAEVTRAVANLEHSRRPAFAVWRSRRLLPAELFSFPVSRCRCDSIAAVVGFSTIRHDPTGVRL